MLARGEKRTAPMIYSFPNQKKKKKEKSRRRRRKGKKLKVDERRGEE